MYVKTYQGGEIQHSCGYCFDIFQVVDTILIFGEAKMIDLSVLTTIGAIVFIVVFFIYSKIQLAKQHEKIKKINEEKQVEKF